MNSEINQENINTDGGDNAGRDLIKQIFISQRASRLNGLIKRFRDELRRSAQTEDKHPVIEHYGTNIDRKIIGLEEKLKKASLSEDNITRAMIFKEIFYKTITERRFYKSGQEIYSELMNRVYHAFVVHVVPLIDQKASQNTINAEVSVIIQNIANEIGDNIDIVSIDQIEGIIYYLTGNCHLKWHKE